MTESLRFSASVSMALSRTWVSLRAVTSRLTSQRRRSRPASSEPFCGLLSACSTASTSLLSSAQASMGLSKRPSSSAAKAQPPRSIIHTTPVCKIMATIKTRAAPPIQPRAPSQNALRSWAGIGSCRVWACTRCPAQARKLPIHTTGCQRTGGSPSQRSTAKATNTAPPHKRTGRVCTLWASVVIMLYDLATGWPVFRPKRANKSRSELPAGLGVVSSLSP